MFAYSCKQANNHDGQKPTISDEITITISGDEGVIVKEPKTIKSKKSSTWKDIKQKAIEKIKTKENKEIKEWHLNNKDGELIGEGKEFKENTTVFAITKEKETPEPPANSIIITIEIDSGYTFKESKKPCTIQVEKNTAWSNIKEKADAKIELKNGYEKTGYKLSGEGGGYIEDAYVFNENAVVLQRQNQKTKTKSQKF